MKVVKIGRTLEDSVGEKPPYRQNAPLGVLSHVDNPENS